MGHERRATDNRKPLPVLSQFGSFLFFDKGVGQIADVKAMLKAYGKLVARGDIPPCKLESVDGGELSLPWKVGKPTEGEKASRIEWLESQYSPQQ